MSPREHMTKPRRAGPEKSGPAKNEKAPKATMPKAPFHRRDDKRPDERSAIHEPRLNPYPASKKPGKGANRPEQRGAGRPEDKRPNAQEHGIGARVSRRASDRL